MVTIQNELIVTGLVSSVWLIGNVTEFFGIAPLIGQLLSDTGLLSLPLGRLIAAAAVLDDVISLVLLAEVQALSDDSATTWDFLLPVIGSIGAIVVGSVLVWLLNARGAALEKLAENTRDALNNIGSSAALRRQRDSDSFGGTPASRVSSLQRTHSGERPPSHHLPPTAARHPGGHASIAPARQLVQPPPPVVGRADANSTMETVQLDGATLSAVSEIVTNASAASGVSVASRASTVQPPHNVSIPVTATNSVVTQQDSRLGGGELSGTSRSNGGTSSVRLHTVTLPSATTNTSTMPHVSTQAITTQTHTAGGTGTATGNETAGTAQGGTEPLSTIDAMRTATAATPVARASPEVTSVQASNRPVLSVSDHFSTHDGMGTLDSAMHHGLLQGESTRGGDASSQSASQNSSALNIVPSVIYADSRPAAAQAGRPAPPPSAAGRYELHAVSSGQEGEDVVTEEQVSSTSAAAPSVQDASVISNSHSHSHSHSRSGELPTVLPLQHARPAPVRLREEVVTVHSEASVNIHGSASTAGHSSSEQSYTAGGSPLPPPGTTSLPPTPNGTAEWPAASAPKRMSHSLAAMRLSTINSESNMLTRTADSDAMAAASQRALQLMDSLEEERATSVGRLLLALLFALAIGLAAACSAVRSSDLMGVFFAGVSFSGIASVKAAWKQHVHGFVSWGSALFFACTVGFAVPPVATLFTAGAVLRGVCLLVVAVLGKLALGLWAYPLSTSNAFLLGWAMNGRGEFSFLITQQATESGLLGDDLGAAVVWAVVLSTVMAPVGFRFVAKRAGLAKRD